MFRRALLLCLSAVCLPGLSEAQITLLDQPVRGEGQSAAGNFADEGCDLETAGSFDNATLAEDFAVAADVEVTDLTLWGIYVLRDPTLQNAPPPTQSLFTAIFHTDAAGLPDTAVATRSGVVATRTFEFTTGFGDVFRFDLDLSGSPVLLTPGTYWVEIFADTITEPSPGCFMWRSADPDPVNTIPGFVRDDAAPGVSFNKFTNDDWSLVVQGREPLEEPAPGVLEIPVLDRLGLGALVALLLAAGLLVLRRTG